MSQSSPASVTIRPATADDYPAWRPLWDAYLVFYQAAVSEEITLRTWQRCLNDSWPLLCMVAVDAQGHLTGFALTVLHWGSWSEQPVAYLEDLFVAPRVRGQGTGRQLIEALAARGRQQGWRRLYWQTHRDNLTAQRLYDQVAEKTAWVRYDLDLIP